MKKGYRSRTVVGTDIEEVKELNANSGMTYNELNEWFAKKVQHESIDGKKEDKTKIPTNNM